MANFFKILKTGWPHLAFLQSKPRASLIAEVEGQISINWNVLRTVADLDPHHGSRIRICIRVKSRIKTCKKVNRRIRIHNKVKFRSFEGSNKSQRGDVDAHNEVWRLKIDPLWVGMPVVAGLHHWWGAEAGTGSGAGSASQRQVGSGTASKWKVGSGSASKWKSGSGFEEQYHMQIGPQRICSNMKFWIIFNEFLIKNYQIICHPRYDWMIQEIQTRYYSL